MAQPDDTDGAGGEPRSPDPSAPDPLLPPHPAGTPSPALAPRAQSAAPRAAFPPVGPRRWDFWHRSEPRPRTAAEGQACAAAAAQRIRELERRVAAVEREGREREQRRRRDASRARGAAAGQRGWFTHKPPATFTRLSREGQSQLTSRLYDEALEAREQRRVLRDRELGSAPPSRWRSTARLGPAEIEAANERLYQEATDRIAARREEHAGATAVAVAALRERCGRPEVMLSELGHEDTIGRLGVADLDTRKERLAMLSKKYASAGDPSPPRTRPPMSGKEVAAATARLYDTQRQEEARRRLEQRYHRLPAPVRLTRERQEAFVERMYTPPS